MRSGLRDFFLPICFLWLSRWQIRLYALGDSNSLKSRDGRNDHGISLSNRRVRIDLLSRCDEIVLVFFISSRPADSGLVEPGETLKIE